MATPAPQPDQPAHRPRLAAVRDARDADPVTPAGGCPANDPTPVEFDAPGPSQGAVSPPARPSRPPRPGGTASGAPDGAATPNRRPSNTDGQPTPDTGPTAPVSPRRLRLTPAAAIRLRPTYWTWDGRIPAGALTVAPGREGIGKSLFCAWLSAQLTRGTLPGIHHGQPRPVIYAATEDSWERTLAGRLQVAGADMDLVYRVEIEALTGATLPLSLPRDCDQLADEITRLGVAALILDPLISAVDDRINVNQDGELRKALEPLGRLADTTGAAVVGLAHFNKKDGTDVLSRVTGSRAFAAVARAAIAFARDPDAEDSSCVLTQVKNNLGRLDLSSLRYSVDSVSLATAEGPGEWGRLRMLGETSTSVDEILAGENREPGEHRRRDRAADWLANYLTEHGGSAPSGQIKGAAREAGISARTLARARDTLKVMTESGGFPKTTLWRLP